jgi:hypothetical protein
MAERPATSLDCRLDWLYGLGIGLANMRCSRTIGHEASRALSDTPTRRWTASGPESASCWGARRLGIREDANPDTRYARLTPEAACRR